MNKITSLGYMKDRIYKISKKNMNKNYIFNSLIICNYEIMISDKLKTYKLKHNYYDKYIYVENEVQSVISDFFDIEHHAYIYEFLNKLKKDMACKKLNKDYVNEQFRKIAMQGIGIEIFEEMDEEIQ
ncbi:hypothetical protein [Methylovorus glucosotrophus]|uniref:Uncharacterized protein n=1 Tax=Methylovorus glucosotrophus (strain SIP3-4) TaxID=582744 RepID=C6X7Y8_METGS|nr:hypothetical protein [Methylovorus glucosotrophus]ACT51315.1 hypothetical protein Msip34_2073 [Methylovorus glucosotrophus SIP3-4]